MRRLILVLALVVGFFVVAGRAGEGFRVVGVAAAGTLCGFTLIAWRRFGRAAPPPAQP